MAQFSSNSGNPNVEAKLSELSLDGNAKKTNEWPSARIRQTFIDYFVSEHAHKYWASSPVVPLNDPTLLFINAGMNQFKPLFLGTCDPTMEMASLKAAVNSQKCIRAGGKHNDLEDVGKDVYHHTFFEMLGNWSFADYFKEEALAWSWDLLTRVYGLSPDRLYATYFGGDASKGLACDTEARDIWLRFLPANRVISSSYKDNFWEMGPTGPCGPCSEIHYDRIGNRDAAHLVNADVPDVIEIWNNVFIQFNRENETTLKELPEKHVDTGMGLERLASILQGHMSNYDTDIFMPIFGEIQRVCNSPPYTGLVGKDDVGLKDMAYRVLGDHIRTLSVAIADGAMPAAEGRGYVLRRILRRAVRYGQEILGAPAGFFTQLVPIVVRLLGDFFPTLKERQDYITAVIEDEEKSFVRTLDQGVKYFKRVADQLRNEGATIVPAKDVHMLFSSMGFPVDLTELMAREQGMGIDMQGFESLMERDRQISAAAELARKGGGSKDMSMAAEQTVFLQDTNVAITNTDAKYTWYQNIPATVTGLYTGRGGEGNGFTQSVSSEDGMVGLLLDQTSFYYESGGQIFDTGKITLANGVSFVVENSQAYAGYVVHSGYVMGGKISVGEKCTVCVDYDRRALIAPNHTMTHVLNFALRRALCEEAPASGGKLVVSVIDQKGSLVDNDKLRFDFSWNGPLTSEQLARVEKIVNEQIQSALPVYAEVVPLREAKEISSLRSVFGERYPDPVRVISVGANIQQMLADPKSDKWGNSSVEFCGGTHLTNTKEAEVFVLAEETGIAKGIRRITGFTRTGAKAAKEVANGFYQRLGAMFCMPVASELNEAQKALAQDIDRASCSVVDKDTLRKGLAKITDSLKVWQKAKQEERLNAACAAASEAAAAAKVAGQAISVLQFADIDGTIAKKIHEKMKEAHPEGSFFLCSIDDAGQKIGLFPLVCPVHINAGLSAKDWNAHCFSIVGSGNGGGKADSAAGGIVGNQTVLDTVKEAAKAFGLSKVYIKN
jgi:alanyl-tRNA synthetase